MDNMEKKGMEMPEENQQLMVMDDGSSFLADITSAKNHFSSLKGESREEKAQLFRAMNNPDFKLSDCINQTIKVKDVYIEVLSLVNKETGEVSDCPRIVLIDDQGMSFQAVSIGIYNSMKKLIQVFGAPTWEDPIEIKIKQVTRGERKMLTFDIA